MNNKYLYITVGDESITIDACDGVFSLIKKVKNKKEFYVFCEGKAKEWLESKLGNYSHWKKEDRKAVADKWLKAKSLKKGKYDYYFNIENLQDIFRKEVEALAKSMGIKYTLEIL